MSALMYEIFIVRDPKNGELRRYCQTIEEQGDDWWEPVTDPIEETAYSQQQLETQAQEYPTEYEDTWGTGEVLVGHWSVPGSNNNR